MHNFALNAFSSKQNNLIIMKKIIALLLSLLIVFGCESNKKIIYKEGSHYYEIPGYYEEDDFIDVTEEFLSEVSSAIDFSSTKSGLFRGEFTDEKSKRAFNYTVEILDDRIAVHCFNFKLYNRDIIANNSDYIYFHDTTYNFIKDYYTILDDRKA